MTLQILCIKVNGPVNDVSSFSPPVTVFNLQEDVEISMSVARVIGLFLHGFLHGLMLLYEYGNPLENLFFVDLLFGPWFPGKTERVEKINIKYVFTSAFESLFFCFFLTQTKESTQNKFSNSHQKTHFC